MIIIIIIIIIIIFNKEKINLKRDWGGSSQVHKCQGVDKRGTT